MTSAMNIASLFIEISEGCNLTNMKLNKILYFVQAAHYAEFGTPAFEDDFEAWTHGPVIREVYFAYRHKCKEEISKSVFEYDPSEVSQNTENFILSIAKSLLNKSASWLRDVTHIDGSPWDNNFEQHMNNIIPKEEIMTYYWNLKITNKAIEAAKKIPRISNRNPQTGNLVIPANFDAN